jgi:hypothetical protein
MFQATFTLRSWKIPFQVVAAEVIVIPLSALVPSSPLLQHHRTSPILCDFPVYKICSVVVVLPASI